MAGSVNDGRDSVIIARAVRLTGDPCTVLECSPVCLVVPIDPIISGRSRPYVRSQGRNGRTWLRHEKPPDRGSRHRGSVYGRTRRSDGSDRRQIRSRGTRRRDSRSHNPANSRNPASPRYSRCCSARRSRHPGRACIRVGRSEPIWRCSAEIRAAPSGAEVRLPSSVGPQTVSK